MYQGKFAAPKGTKKPAKRSAGSAAPEKATKGTKIFYACYFCMIALLVIGIIIGLIALHNFLVKFQASQVETKFEEVYNEYFADPDWGKIYDRLSPEQLGGLAREDFIAAMEEKVGDARLESTATSAGMGKKKFLLKVDGETVVSFTLENKAPGAIYEEWELYSIDLGSAIKFTEYEVTVTVPDGCTVSVNGTALDDSHIIRTTTTKAEELGYSGPKTKTFFVDGLKAEPQVSVTDAQGNALDVTKDASGVYVAGAEAPQISDEQQSAITNAGKTYCQFMIGATYNLSRYFDSSTDIYTTITNNELWVRGYTGYTFNNIVVSDFYQYSDTLFSATLTLDFDVTRGDGSVKTWPVSSTFILELQNGIWKVIDMMNQNIMEETVMVRLTYTVDGTLVLSEMVDAASKSLTPYAVTVPEGKVFLGWFREIQNADGSTTLALVFTPDENGTVALPSGYTLEPMDLIAQFGDEGAQ